MTLIITYTILLAISLIGYDIVKSNELDRYVAQNNQDFENKLAALKAELLEQLTKK